MDKDEHSPYWQETGFPLPQETWGSFFMACLRLILLMIAVGMVVEVLK